MSAEKELKPVSGWSKLPMVLLMIAAGPVGLILGIMIADSVSGVLGGLVIISSVISGLSGLLLAFGFQAIAPNDARVMLLFGDYKGSVT